MEILPVLPRLAKIAPPMSTEAQRAAMAMSLRGDFLAVGAGIADLRVAVKRKR